jgi:hypothetical protein
LCFLDSYVIKVPYQAALIYLYPDSGGARLRGAYREALLALSPETIRDG